MQCDEVYEGDGVAGGGGEESRACAACECADADTMKVMRAELEAWMAQQNDAGMKTELEAPDRMNPASEKYQLYQKYKMSLKKD